MLLHGIGHNFGKLLEANAPKFQYSRKIKLPSMIPRVGLDGYRFGQAGYFANVQSVRGLENRLI